MDKEQRVSIALVAGGVVTVVTTHCSGSSGSNIILRLRHADTPSVKKSIISTQLQLHRIKKT